MPVTESGDAYGRIAELYDLEHDQFEDDLDFYRRIVAAGPVLEIGAGTGRVLSALVGAGWEAWGVEPSRAMIERARARLDGSRDCHLIHAGVLEADLPGGFGTALFPLNTLWHLVDARAQLLALTRVRDALQPDGMIVVDTTNPLVLSDRRSRGEWRSRFVGARGPDRVTCDSATWDDESEQQMAIELRYEVEKPSGLVRRTSTSLTLRYIFAAELQLMLGRAGFGRMALFGTYEEDPYTAESPGLIAVATRV